MNARTNAVDRLTARANKVLTWTAIVLVVVGVTKILHPQGAASGPPAPAAGAARPVPAVDGSASRAAAGSASSAAGSASSVATASARHAASPLGFSVPVHVDIPQIAVHAPVISVGLTADHSIDVPPLNQAQKAAWYKLGPAPGETGPAVIDAHVDSAEIVGHRGAFYTLGEALPGQTIEVTRADHVVAIFTIDSVEQAPKAHFPTAKVYARVPYPALRLITCGGPFDSARHTYLDNTIVYAHLTATRHA